MQIAKKSERNILFGVVEESEDTIFGFVKYVLWNLDEGVEFQIEIVFFNRFEK